MKSAIASKVIIGLLAVGVIGGGSFYYYQNQNRIQEQNQNQNGDQKQEQNQKSGNDDFIKTGQYSFGLDVCNEVKKEDVGTVLGTDIVKTRDYSDSSSTGCEYYINEKSFAIVDVGYGKAETQKKGLEVLERKLTQSSEIGLENFISISDSSEGQYIDVYMVVDPDMKYVRVGRSSVSVGNNEKLINLAKKVEQEIRSHK